MMHLLCFTLATIAATATTTITTGASCLPDAIPVEERQNIVLDGTEMPIGIWGFSWDSARLAAQMFKILVQERLGYHAVFTGWSSSSSAGLYAVAGCQDPFQYMKHDQAGCGQNVSSTCHAVMEVWGVAKVNTMKENMASTPEIIPESLGSIGYAGKDGLHIRSREVDRAQETQGLPLRFYQAYNASWMNTTKVWKYFDSPADIDAESIKLCNETRMVNAKEMETYVKLAGDSEGVNKTPDGSLAVNCWGRWWLAPACRSTPSKCIPVITGGSGWGIFDFQQKATVFNMPLALAVAAGDQYEALTRKHRVLLYYYTPNDSLGDIFPERIMFPEYDAIKWQKGDRTTMALETKLSKWVHNKLSRVAPLVYGLAKNMLIAMSTIENLTTTMRISNITLETATCRWIQENSAIWKDWIPDKSCEVGMGLVKSYVDKGVKRFQFVTNISDADWCSWCIPGRYSFQLRQNSSIHTSICKLCPEGKFSNDVGVTECKMAPRGYYVAEHGQVSPTLCPAGAYTSEEGHRSCIPCSDFHQKSDKDGYAIFPRTTALLGASSVDLCICAGGSFPYRGGCAQCKDFEGLECQKAYGMNNPKLIEGFMSVDKDPYTIRIYSCFHDDACEGKREAFVDPMCTNMRTGVACSRCIDGYSARMQHCVPCAAKTNGSFFEQIPAEIDILFAFVMIFVVCTATYFESMQEREAEELIFGLILGFFQAGGVICTFDVAWPPALSELLSLIEYVVALYGLRLDCFNNSTMSYRLLAKVFYPLLLQLTFCCVFVFWKLSHRTFSGRCHCKLLDCLPESLQKAAQSKFAIFWPIKKKNMLNCMQFAHLALFISILAISFSLFKCQRHPSGVYTVSTFQDVECYSDEWWDALPIALVSICVYCVSFTAWILYLIWQAPVRVGSDPKFVIRYRFSWEKWHPSRWWFTIADVLMAVFINCVSIFTSNGYKQLYLTCFIVTVYVVITLSLKPWKFHQNNIVDACVKLGLMLLCLIATSYIESRPGELEAVQQEFQHVFVLVFFVPCFIALFCLCFVVWRKYLGKAHSHMERLQLAQRFRDVMAMASSMSSCEFTRLMANTLVDQDRLDLLQATDVLVAHVLKMQPGKRFSNQIIMPGIPYTVATNASIGAAICKRGLHELPAMQDQQLLSQLGRELSQYEANHFFDPANSQSSLGITDSAAPTFSVSASRASASATPRSKRGIVHKQKWSKHINKFRGLQSAHSCFHILDVNEDGVLTKEEFKDTIKFNAINTLTSKQIEYVFELIDLDGNGTIKVEEMCAALEFASTRRMATQDFFQSGVQDSEQPVEGHSSPSKPSSVVPAAPEVSVDSLLARPAQETGGKKEEAGRPRPPRLENLPSREGCDGNVDGSNQADYDGNVDGKKDTAHERIMPEYKASEAAGLPGEPSVLVNACPKDEGSSKVERKTSPLPTWLESKEPLCLE